MAGKPKHANSSARKSNNTLLLPRSFRPLVLQDANAKRGSFKDLISWLRPPEGALWNYRHGMPHMWKGFYHEIHIKIARFLMGVEAPLETRGCSKSTWGSKFVQIKVQSHSIAVAFSLPVARLRQPCYPEPSRQIQRVFCCSDRFITANACSLAEGYISLQANHWPSAYERSERKASWWSCPHSFCVH